MESGHTGVLRHILVVGAPIVADLNGVRQVFHKGDVLHAKRDTPRPHGAGAEDGVAGNAVTAVKAEGRAGPAGIHGRHAFGAVIRIGVVAGAVPQEQAGDAEIKLVFRDGGSQPAAALQVDGLAGRAVVSAERADGAHIHGAVVEVTGEAEGAERGHFARDADPPCVAFAAVAFKRGQIAAAGEHGEHTGAHIVDIPLGVAAKAAAAHKAVHAPRRDLHAVKGQRQGQADEIHGVVLIVTPLAVTVGVVVFGTQPEEVRTDVFGQVAADGDPRAVAVEHGGTGHEARHHEGLQAHADQHVGFGDGPVDVGIAHFNGSAVRAEGRAVLGMAPMRVADFKIDDTLQAFGCNHINLGAQALRRTEAVAAAVLVERIVRILKIEVPHPLGLDVGRIGGGKCGADKAGRKQKRGESLHDENLLSSW